MSSLLADVDRSDYFAIKLCVVASILIMGLISVAILVRFRKGPNMPVAFRMMYVGIALTIPATLTDGFHLNLPIPDYIKLPTYFGGFLLIAIGAGTAIVLKRARIR